MGPGNGARVYKLWSREHLHQSNFWDLTRSFGGHGTCGDTRVRMIESIRRLLGDFEFDWMDKKGEATERTREERREKREMELEAKILRMSARSEYRLLGLVRLRQERDRRESMRC